MGLLQRIENMRKKSEIQRERIVIVSAVSITALLFLFWVFDFSMTTRLPGDVPEDAAPSPVSILLDNMKAVFTDATDAFRSIGTEAGTTTTTTEQ